VFAVSGNQVVSKTPRWYLVVSMIMSLVIIQCRQMQLFFWFGCLDVDVDVTTAMVVMMTTADFDALNLDALDALDRDDFDGAGLNPDPALVVVVVGPHGDGGLRVDLEVWSLLSG